jgi:hypothetical protein
MTLLHILPRQPDAIDGIGNYAATLGLELRSRYGVESVFISSDSAAGSLSKAAQDSGADQVLVHYSGYGFHRRGIPWWLVKELKTIQARSCPSIAVFFHEIWASGPPWRSAFYLQPLQQRIARQLYGLAEICFTSTPKMRRLLEREKQLILAPIPSPFSPGALLSHRANSGPLSFVIFGQEHTRQRSVRAHGPLLQRIAESSLLEGLVLVGKGAGPESCDFHAASEFVPAASIKTPSNVAGNRIAMVIAEADLALSFYPSNLVTKSTTIMAAFACGTPVLLPEAARLSADEFTPAPPLLFSEGFPADVERLVALRAKGELNRIAAEALAWYERNASWAVVTERIGRGLGLDRGSSVIVR